MTWFHFTRQSRNAKTGLIATTTTEARTCPPSCPLFDECYGKGGPQAMHWAKVNEHARGGDLAYLTANVRALNDGELWRHDVTGDLPGIGERINGRELRAITAANAGRRGFTYTHKRPEVGDNARHIFDANVAGFTVNLSANTLAQADAYADLNIGPVCTVLPADQTENCNTPEGRAVIVCPATQRDDVTCASCKMCQVRDRAIIIGFPLHGSRKRMADNKLQQREQQS